MLAVAGNFQFDAIVGGRIIVLPTGEIQRHLHKPPIVRCADQAAQSQATVSVLDRGFLFGDGVYEVIPVFAGKPLRLTEHLDRLRRSMSRVSLKNPLTQQARYLDKLVDELARGKKMENILRAG